ncbi:type VI secretion system TssO [Paraflavitalea pollutisoli]|uniref:type VI secretion system TssO n=1 Tax=Paraflavitalea pollutisoli TaxID=3034143 RepID=UPI0023EC6B61|nr:type VI secretion system TssO [Paraflavitalea sp. H1-2-19X]
MPPINQDARRKSFMYFLLFFVITIGVITTTILFSFQVPFKENQKLRKEMDRAENEKAFLQSFEIKLEETMNLLDSVNLSAENAYLMDSKISRNIDQMLTMSSSDSLSIKGMINVIIDNLKNLQLAKKQLRDVNNGALELEKKDRRIETLEGEVRNYQQILLQQRQPSR